MSRITLREAETLSTGSQKTFQWFQLKNDKDVKKVRFLVDKVDDIDAFVVHSVEVNGRNRWVNCTRSNETEPLDNCPFCKNGDKARVRVFLQLQDVETGDLLIWDRSPQVIQKLRSIEKRLEGPIYQTIIEIERLGKAGDTRTTYEFYPTTRNERIRLEDLTRPINIEEDVFYHGLVNNEPTYDDTSYTPRGSTQTEPTREQVRTEPAKTIEDIGEEKIPERTMGRRVF